LSKPGDDEGAPEKQAFDALERAVAETLERLKAMSARVAAADAKSAELGEVVQRFTGDGDEGGRILTRLKQLEAENVDLKGRLEQGREGVDRMLARIRFLENQE